ncbi:hypothetical protein, conserved [Entamoeba dispar SAW760]|uniref:Rab-GAP TBC domain-containing protein n=1 Tax=Entamoeba dispar (strain ATCC PRA-260 / SAW760) TaxID=370354 RepID=B0E8V5_ENTDS|nr:uncharacterized protein EDI_053860 [Entamoeba dispar SAW760]EDR29043.1 hypothetical protein, conserved [Entamoeba dispar SAW760]|eukprot:EDR29043.1 hypothetical protein, conserved [Entamoeba dispar SAW760]
MFKSKSPNTPRESKESNEKTITVIPHVYVQNEDRSMIDGNIKISVNLSILTFQFRSSISLDGKSRSKNNTFSITFTIDDISGLCISSPINNFDTINFSTIEKHLPSFFFPKDSEFNVYFFLNVIIENGFTIVPKDGQQNVFIIHKRLEKVADILSSSPIDLSQITPIDLKTILSLANEDGSFEISAQEDIRKSTYFSGLQPDARIFVWKLVLGYYQFDMTTKQREELDQKRRKQYFMIKTQWENFVPEQLTNWITMKQTLEQIDKDVRRTDNKHEKFFNEKNVVMLRDVLRTYALYNWRIGYGQGMNDICSLIMEITLDESEIFWLFKSVMDMMEQFYKPRTNHEVQNFEEVGWIIKFVNPSLYDYFIRNNVNYLFCYRWIVLLFKRDFNSRDCLNVWDRIFAYPERKLYYFICSAIILKNGDQIVEKQKGFDGMVEFLQDMHKKIPAQVVYDSDIIYQEFNELADKKYLELMFQN